MSHLVSNPQDAYDSKGNRLSVTKLTQLPKFYDSVLQQSMVETYQIASGSPHTPKIITKASVESMGESWTDALKAPIYSTSSTLQYMRALRDTPRNLYTLSELGLFYCIGKTVHKKAFSSLNKPRTNYDQTQRAKTWMNLMAQLLFSPKFDQIIFFEIICQISEELRTQFNRLIKYPEYKEYIKKLSIPSTIPEYIPESQTEKESDIDRENRIKYNSQLMRCSDLTSEINYIHRNYEACMLLLKVFGDNLHGCFQLDQICYSQEVYDSHLYVEHIEFCQTDDSKESKPVKIRKPSYKNEVGIEKAKELNLNLETLYNDELTFDLIQLIYPYVDAVRTQVVQILSLFSEAKVLDTDDIYSYLKKHS